MLEIGVGTLLATIACGIIHAWIVAHRRRRERLRFYRDQFFEAANRVLQDDKTDDQMLARIKTMASDIDKRKAFRALMKAVTALDAEIRSGKYQPPAPRALPQEWGTLAFNYFIAVSYSRPIAGVRLRDILVHLLDPRSEERNTDVIDRRIHVPQLQPA